MTNPEHLFLLLCWLVALLSTLCLGAVFTDEVLPWIRRRREMKRLKAMDEWPNWLKRQAD